MNLGKTIPKTLYNQDAFFDQDAAHCPAALVLIQAGIKPGDRVRFKDDHLNMVELAPNGENYHGIVDPFIDGAIPDGHAAWVLIRPGLVKRLTHKFELIDEVDDALHKAWCDSVPCDN